MTLEENLEEKSQEAAPAEQPVEQKSSPQKAEPKIEIDETTKCPECHSTHLVRDYERGELVCEECGLVVDENAIDRREDWRDFGEEKDKEKIHASRVNPLRYDKGLGSEIKGKGNISRGARRQQNWARTATSYERNLKYTGEMIDKYTELPKDVRDAALALYKKALDKNFIRGRSIEGVIAAALFTACRTCNVARTFDEIAAMAKYPRKDLANTYKDLVRELELKIIPISPEDYVSRFCSELRFEGQDVQTRTHEILKQVQAKALLCGMSPPAVTGAAIYIAAIVSNQRRTQREITELIGVTEITIRNRYKIILDALPELKTEYEVKSL